MDERHFNELNENWADSELFDDREKSVIGWAESLTENTARDDDEAFSKLKEHFNEQDIVELTLFTCIFNAWNRLQDGFQNDLESPEGRIQWTSKWEESS